SRPDILALTCLLTVVLALKVQRKAIRYCCVFILAGVAVWIGLQVALFACLACAGAWLLFRLPRLWEVVLVGAGMVVGACTLFIFLKSKGVLSYFLPIVVGMMGRHYAHSPHSAFGVALLKTVRQTLTSYVGDFTTVLFGLGVIVTIGLARGRFRPLAISVM